MSQFISIKRIKGKKLHQFWIITETKKSSAIFQQLMMNGKAPYIIYNSVRIISQNAKSSS